MDYGRLIREAWRNTLRYRSLWLLGLFAGGAVGAASGGGGGGRVETGDVEHLPAIEQRVGELGIWLGEHAGLVVAGAALVLGLVLVVLAIAAIAEGGMAQATADVASGRTGSLRRAWGAGRRLFWRYVGLWLLLGVGAALVAGVVGLGAALFSAAPVSGAASVGALTLAMSLAALGFGLAVGLNIVVAYAQRAIAIGDLGPLAALRAGWLLLRANLGTSVLVWLVNLVLATAAGLAIGLVLLLGIGLLVGLGALVWLSAGFSAPLFGYAVVGGIVLVAAALALAGAANTFFWNYWTLAYLRLAGHEEGLSAAA